MQVMYMITAFTQVSFRGPFAELKKNKQKTIAKGGDTYFSYLCIYFYGNKV